MPAAVARPNRSRFRTAPAPASGSRFRVTQPAVTKQVTLTDESPDRAAVNAVVSDVVKTTTAPATVTTTAPATALPVAVAPSSPAAPPKRSPKDAAQALRSFLLRTKRFGSRTDRPQQVRDAQRDLGVEPDGIVGPKTRAAARAAGSILPPKK